MTSEMMQELIIGGQILMELKQINSSPTGGFEVPL